MELFGRPLSRYVIGLSRLPQFIQACWRARQVFEEPGRVILSYITKRMPADRLVRLRGGRVIHLSAGADDILTVFLIFARQDYGSIPSGSTVIDIGANIGVFSVFAAASGAKAVRAFEPSAESFKLLQQNIAANGFGEVIQAQQRAVVGRPSPAVKFPRRSSVYNMMIPASSTERGDWDLVVTTTLSQILSEFDRVDLLKLDCEGAEYDIVPGTPSADLQKIGQIRLEYHDGPRDTLIDRLRSEGFQTRQLVEETKTSDGKGSGYIWLVHPMTA